MIKPNENSIQNSWYNLKGKTLWDWLSLLVVPIVLSVGAVLIEERLRAQQADIETARMRTALTTEFVDKIADLVLHANLKGDHEAPEPAAANAVAQARLNLVLDQLDFVGRRRLVYFLLDMNLVHSGHG